ncbi:DUF1616 domain-containing protein [Caldivirga sp. UBA161]|uniref:DUF1616 domain-containing protein n=1 Tax=Caldivirga sp. UBA161 TaxID=1915569 RepID=UPI0025B85D0C|nr:DUF1616 domain-containing protein [Caldivirga sp. UBA161]
MSIDDYITERVKGGECMSVNELVNDVAARFNISRGQAAYEVLRLWKSGVIDIEDYPYDNLLPYFFTVSGLWYWVIVALTATSLASVILIHNPPLIYLRYALGALIVLFLPGYTLVEALYPRGDELTPLERLALSIGLSLAVEPLIGLILNYTPWGIRLTPILTSTVILILALATVAAVRKARLLVIGRRCLS